ncbi:MAG: hypothetical protein ACYSYL_13320 [Planctomycetota bacterium]|jgi:hypothetical protein
MTIYKGDVWSFTTLAELDSDLVGWWKFDEGEGTIAYDSTGNNHGSIFGANWTTGQINGALTFDGVGDYVDCAHDISFSRQQSWIYLRRQLDDRPN